MIAVADWLRLLENSAWALAIRQSAWLYPFLEIVHITGIVVLVGAAFMFDLRLLGFSKHLPADGLGHHLLTWSVRGLFLIVPSGMLLFITNASTLGHDPVFWTKMALLAAAGGNALFFRRTAPRAGSPAAKTAAVLSLLLWVAVIACGRLLAY
ncbi:hypothetical protein DLD77_10470 [Chitinophaga alhagiae]|uniref:DUF6644 domain-containing protein n=1 Tax=Chitinophaga alhagiae TaxID=2203219 RepID=A0ABM6WDN0_9BACT|nr:DUF6644 family protein [Chitinophaga alhagiae]AWO02089.1 hypothetical protein DLD77_10470 [Chitinophaga alhagiae]